MTKNHTEHINVTGRTMWESKKPTLEETHISSNGTKHEISHTSGTITGFTIKDKPVWNVVEENAFRKKTRFVFEQVAQTLERTLGPYGSTTILEGFSDAHITKDGWQVLKRIRFADRVEQTIHKMLLNISAQVVIKVGDGSTSSIVAANEVLKSLEAIDELKSLRSKDLIDMLKQSASVISQHILQNTTQIDRDGNFEEIRRLAMISTNGETEIADYIQKIYQETKNPSIEFKTSKNHETTYEIIEGYKSDFGYLDAIYQMDETGDCKVDNPIIVLFDHTIDHNHHKHIIQPLASLAISENTRLIVIAPTIDRMLRESIKREVTQQVNGGILPLVVYTSARLNDERLRILFNDYSSLIGARIVTQADMYNLSHQLGKGEDMGEKLSDEIIDPVNFIGRADVITINKEHTLTSGFSNRNELQYKIFLDDAKKRFNALEESHRQLNIVDMKLFEVKKRIAKLSCSMGVIHVGGRSEMSKLALFDLVEDAVKATESAFNYGYNTGGNLVIPIAVADLVDAINEEEIEQKLLMEALGGAFIKVYEKVLSRRFGTESERLNEIAMESLDRRECYNLIKDQFDGTVINPTYTDIEILSAVTAIISLLLSSNQYIALDTE